MSYKWQIVGHIWIFSNHLHRSILAPRGFYISENFPRDDGYDVQCLYSKPFSPWVSEDGEELHERPSYSHGVGEDSGVQCITVHARESASKRKKNSKHQFEKSDWQSLALWSVVEWVWIDSIWCIDACLAYNTKLLADLDISMVGSAVETRI